MSTRHYVAIFSREAKLPDGTTGTEVRLHNVGTKAETIRADASFIDDDEFERMLGQIVGEQGGSHIIVTDAPVFNELVQYLTERRLLMSHPHAIGLLVLLAEGEDPPDLLVSHSSIIGEA